MKESLYLIGNNQSDKSRKQSDKAYVMRLLAEHCMPVLLCVKPANTITIYKRKIENQFELLEYFHGVITSFDCELSILYENERMLFLILYQPSKLAELLNQYEYRRFLSEYGYCLDGDLVNNTLNCLSQRYQDYREKRTEFPHEIGIILGYPIEDVIGFIKNRGKNYRFQGYWKVYGDVENAKKYFNQIHFAKEQGRKIFDVP